jgi:predicted O-methyltransferase YrrM
MYSETEYQKICNDLKEIITKTNEPLEGNCVYKHLTFDVWDILINKRKNYETVSTGRKNICEIGFNAGHSIVVMILNNPEAEYVLFDLGVHLYSKPCLKYIKKYFKDTKIDVYWGDSTEMLPKYISQNNAKFDLVHIDGSHRSKIYTQDWNNSITSLKSGGMLIFDDSDSVKVTDFLNSKVISREVTEYLDILKTSGYEHRVFVKK